MQSDPTSARAAAAVPTSLGRASTLLSAVLAMTFGTFLLFGAGFAAPQAIHDAAHDGRHVLTFPCH